MSNIIANSTFGYLCGMSEKLQKAVGLAVKEARKKAGITQKDLAEKVGLQQSNIAKLESGGYNISLEKLEAIAEACGVGVSVVLA